MMIRFVRVSLIATVLSLLGMGDTILHQADQPGELSVVTIITLISAVIAVVVTVSGAILNWSRAPHQDRVDESSAARDSAESSDLNAAARLKLEVSIEAKNKQIAALMQQLVELGPKYAVSFVLDSSGTTPTLTKVQIDKLAETGIDPKDKVTVGRNSGRGSGLE